jgi:hypothetical protein
MVDRARPVQSSCEGRGAPFRGCAAPFLGGLPRAGGAFFARLERGGPVRRLLFGAQRGRRFGRRSEGGGRGRGQHQQDEQPRGCRG